MRRGPNPLAIGGEQLSTEQLVDKIRQQQKEIEYLKRQRKIPECCNFGIEREVGAITE